MIGLLVVSSSAAYASNTEEAIIVKLNNTNIAVNGQNIATLGQNMTLADGAQIPCSITYKGVTYLPIDHYSEALNKEVTMDTATQTLNINDPSNTDITGPGWYLSNVNYIPNQYDGQTITSSTSSGETGTTKTTGTFSNDVLTIQANSTFEGSASGEQTLRFIVKNYPEYIEVGQVPKVTIQRIEDVYHNKFDRGAYANIFMQATAWHQIVQGGQAMTNTPNQWGAYGGSEYFIDQLGNISYGGVHDTEVTFSCASPMIRHDGYNTYIIQLMMNNYVVEYQYEWKQ
jgi:hypothetical protein